MKKEIYKEILGTILGIALPAIVLALIAALFIPGKKNDAGVAASQLAKAASTIDVSEKSKNGGISRRWESKPVGDMKYSVVLTDVGTLDDEDEILREKINKFKGHRISVTTKSKNNPEYDSKEFFLSADELKNIDYKQANVYTLYEPGDDGDFSKNQYLCVFVPLGCKYIKVKEKKIKPQKCEIYVKGAGIARFKVCVFDVKNSLGAYNDGYVKMCDGKGIIHSLIQNRYGE